MVFRHLLSPDLGSFFLRIAFSHLTPTPQRYTAMAQINASDVLPQIPHPLEL
jgi:hypothetical protein